MNHTKPEKLLTLHQVRYLQISCKEQKNKLAEEHWKEEVTVGFVHLSVSKHISAHSEMSPSQH